MVVQVRGEPRVGQLYGVGRIVLRPLIYLLWHLEVEGIRRVPATGGAILAANHLSAFDHFLLGATLPRQITFVGKAEYLDSWKTRYVLPALGMIPIDRSGGAASERALDAASAILAAGGLFGIYPEGTRSRDGRLHKGHTGLARLARRTRCPIIPVGLQGTAEVMPPDAPVPRPFKALRVRVGRPIDPEHDEGPDDHLALRRLTDEVMFEIRALTGQEYVDRYATRDSEDVPTPVASVHPTPVVLAGAAPA